MDDLKVYLEKLGLSPEESDVYVFLLQNGDSTILEISRSLSMNRTSLYRLCERLAKKGFIHELSQVNSTKYEAVAFENLENKISDKLAKIDELEELSDDALIDYQKVSKMKDNLFRVDHYKGKKEAKQLVWNCLRAEGEILSFGYKTLAEVLGKTFLLKWWERILKLEIPNKLIMNPGTEDLKNAQVTENLKQMYPNPVENKVWQVREIDKDVLNIKYETFIYNDIYAVLQWKQNQVFGLEVQNKSIAEHKKREFFLLWDSAKND